MVEQAQITALSGARIFDGERIVEGCAVLIGGARILDVVTTAGVPEDAVCLDLNGRLLAPGFIDVQVNGGGGVLFNDQPNVAGIATIAETHRRFGSTGILPTLITDDETTTVAAAHAVIAARENKVPGVLGIHFEGPALNAARKGVHDATLFRALSDQMYDLLALEGLGQRLVTLAPETVPAGTVARLVAMGVHVSAGHTAATYQQTQDALAEGLAGFTHLFNAMPPMASRAPGPVGAALEDQNSWCGLIVDGHHVHAATLKAAIAAKRTGQMMLVTDAMPSVGVDQNQFMIRGATISVVDKRCTSEDGTLAGSDLDMASAVRNTVDMLGLPLEEALRMASLYPATFLGMADQRGRIAANYCADLVELTDDLNVCRTWIGGDMAEHLAEQDIN